MADDPAKLDIRSKGNRKEWMEAAHLISQAIPNAVISKLGRRFGALYYSKFAADPDSCVYFCFDFKGMVQGIIIGTLNYPRAASAAIRGNMVKLFLSANFTLLRPSVIIWLMKNVFERVRHQNQQNSQSRPAAELVVIALREDTRGSGIAKALVAKMEEFMKNKHLEEPYVILTEKSNERANRFYRKIGANFIGTQLRRGRNINLWHKYLE